MIIAGRFKPDLNGNTKFLNMGDKPIMFLPRIGNLQALAMLLPGLFYQDFIALFSHIYCYQNRLRSFIVYFGHGGIPPEVRHHISTLEDLCAAMVNFRGYGFLNPGSHSLDFPMYYGPEFLGQVFVSWCEDNGIFIDYIEPGKPNQNAFIERFNRSLRNEVLDLYLFRNLAQVREIVSQWKRQYNEDRPHDALGGLPPVVYVAKELENSNLELST